MSTTTRLAASVSFALAVLVPTAAVRAQNSDRALLATFCGAADIRGSTCKRAKAYPAAGRRRCDVALSPSRYTGKFMPSGAPLLVVTYESGCEPHATDGGGSVVFEQLDGGYAFRGFQPGVRVNDCVTLAKDDRQDRLVCLTGHMGQGVLESRVAQMAFTRESSKRIAVTHDFLLNAEDSNGARGANVVACTEPPPTFFELTRLRVGPRPGTVALDAGFADAETIRTACSTGFPSPEETFGDLVPGEAYVPRGFEKKGTFVIDLGSRQVAPQN